VDARRDLIDHRPVGGSEKLDREHADMAEGLGDAQRRGACFLDLWCDEVAGGDGRAAEDSAFMLVARAIPEGVAAVGPAREDYREFRAERDPGPGGCPP